jgi:hypothetical protein
LKLLKNQVPPTPKGEIKPSVKMFKAGYRLHTFHYAYLVTGGKPGWKKKPVTDDRSYQLPVFRNYSVIELIIYLFQITILFGACLTPALPNSRRLATMAADERQ